MVSLRHAGLISLITLLTVPMVAVAQEEAPVKIGFVDVEKAVFAIDEGKARLDELQKWAQPRQEELGRLNKDITDLQNEIAQKRGVANDDALADLNRRLIAKQREFEDKQRDGKREFDLRQNKILEDLGKKLNEVITRYADENRFTAVFILKPNDLVYLANSADITGTIVNLYNERYPYAGGGN